MVDAAGMNPEAPDRLRPGPVDRPVHQPTAGTLPDDRLRQPEESEFAFALLPKIELQQAFRPPVAHDRVNFDLAILDDRRKRRIRHCKPRHPEPVGTDAAIEIAVKIDVRRRNQFERQVRLRRVAARGRPRHHFKARHNGGDLAGRHVRISIQQHGNSFILPHR